MVEVLDLYKLVCRTYNNKANKHATMTIIDNTTEAAPESFPVVVGAPVFEPVLLPEEQVKPVSTWLGLAQQ
jgi:hypothetical protein